MAIVLQTAVDFCDSVHGVCVYPDSEGRCAERKRQRSSKSDGLKCSETCGRLRRNDCKEAEEEISSEHHFQMVMDVSWSHVA